MLQLPRLSLSERRTGTREPCPGQLHWCLPQPCQKEELHGHLCKLESSRMPQAGRHSFPEETRVLTLRLELQRDSPNPSKTGSSGPMARSQLALMSSCACARTLQFLWAVLSAQGSCLAASSSFCSSSSAISRCQPPAICCRCLGSSCKPSALSLGPCFDVRAGSSAALGASHSSSCQFEWKLPYLHPGGGQEGPPQDFRLNHCAKQASVSFQTTTGPAG